MTAIRELTTQYQQLLKAYKQLAYIVETFAALSAKQSFVSTEIEENYFITRCDALIQRFEFCFDITWKFLKSVLREKHALEANSPRAVIE